MSKLGFDKIIKRINTAERNFLKKGMIRAQKEFNHNFDKETNSETKENWPVLSRPEPPSKLNVSGALKKNTLYFGNVRFYPGRAILLIDPIDKKGRGYAEYHQEGINQYKSKKEFERKFVTQSRDLDEDQKKILMIEVDRAFRGDGSF